MQYEIGGVTFTQSKLKLGQIKQLLPYFDKIASALDSDNDVNVIDFINKVKDDITDIIAIVLVEKDKSLKDKDIKQLAGFLDDNMDYDIMLDVVADFFTLTPVGLIGNKLEKIVKTINGKVIGKKVTG